jgi:hypothetical protein
MKSHRRDTEHAEVFEFFPRDLCVLCGEKVPDSKIGETPATNRWGMETSGVERLWKSFLLERSCQRPGGDSSTDFLHDTYSLSQGNHDALVVGQVVKG